MTLERLWLAWNSFWFTNQSPVPLALFRILMGLLVLAFCWGTKDNAATFFGQKAIVSPDTSTDWFGAPMLSVFSGDDVQLIYSLLWISGTCLTLGLFSRISAFVVYLLLLSLQSLDCFVFYNIIELLLLMCFYLALSRCGAALSLDRLISVWLPGKAHFGPARPGSIVGQRVIQIQVALLYWSAFASKLNGGCWVDGTALCYITQSNVFQQFIYPWDIVASQTWLLKSLTWGTVVVEAMLFSLIWVKEFRYPVLMLGLVFHAGMEATLSIPLLQLIMVCSYVTFIEPDDLSRWMNALRHWIRSIAGPPRVFRYNGSRLFSCRVAETIRRVDVFQLIYLQAE